MSTTYLHIVCPHVFPEIRGRTTQHRGFTGIYGVECAHHCRSRGTWGINMHRKLLRTNFAQLFCGCPFVE